MPDDGPSDTPPPLAPRPRRRTSVWQPFVATAVAMSLTVGAQAVVGVGIGVVYVASGGDARRLAADLHQLVTAPAAFVALLLAGQVAVLVTAVAVARMAPTRPRGGLGFALAAVPAWGYPVLAFGTLAPAGAAGLVADAVARVVPADPTLTEVAGRVPAAWAVPFALFVALVPGFVEEAFFRGYVQRRLLMRWPAWAAVATTAGLFGLIHVSPAAAASAFVLGLWLGAVARRTGSVWPAVLCHAVVNGAWAVEVLGPRFGVIPDPLPVAAEAGGGLVALACFGVSVRLLRRAAPPALPVAMPVGPDTERPIAPDDASRST